MRSQRTIEAKGEVNMLIFLLLEINIVKKKGTGRWKNIILRKRKRDTTSGGNHALYMKNI